MIALGRYRRKADGKNVWVTENISPISAAGQPQIRIRRPETTGTYETRVVSARGFLDRHEKVSDNGL